MNCIYCNYEIEPGWKACPSCGERLPETLTCKSCGETVQTTWKVCPICGGTTNNRSSQISISDSVVREIHQTVNPKEYSVVMSPSIEVSPTIHVGEAKNTCPNCGSDLGNKGLKQCKYCTKSYCSSCEIDHIACPSCGMPYEDLRKMLCRTCQQVFAISDTNKRIIEELDGDEIRSVKQRCRCPRCGRTSYYSGNSGFIDLGEYTSTDIRNEYIAHRFTFATLEEFRTDK